MNITLNNTVDIWYLYKSQLLSLPFNWRKILSTEELSRADRFRFDEDKETFTIYHACKRIILAKYLKKLPHEIEISIRDTGKPFLKNNELFFNLSHTKNVAIFAVTLHTEIGVDIEYIKKTNNFLEIAKRFFHQNEYKKLKNMPDAEQQDYFYLAWTAKEAILKATGQGISAGLNSFWIAPHLSEKHLLTHSYPQNITLLRLNSPKNYLASLAILENQKMVRYQKFTL